MITAQTWTTTSVLASPGVRILPNPPSSNLRSSAKVALAGETRYCQKLLMASDQAAALRPSTNLTPAIRSAINLLPFNARQLFSAD